MSQTGARVHKRATYADLEALPDHLVGEILVGTSMRVQDPACGMRWRQLA